MAAGFHGLGSTAPGEASAPVDVVLLGCTSEENLALGYLASSCDRNDLRAEIAGYADVDQLEAVEARALTFRPRAIGLSMAFQAHAPALMRLAERLRKAGFRGHLFAGGHFATLACDQVLRDAPALDSVVLHEGEETIVELLQALSGASSPRTEPRETVAGLAWRRRDGSLAHNPARRLPPLDSLAWPRRSRSTIRRMGVGVAPIVGSRGCYGSCSFCSIHAWHRTANGPRFRRRGVDDIAREMAWLRRERDVQVFDFQDDNFFVPSRQENLVRVRDLDAALRDHGVDDVALLLKARPTDVDEEVLDALARIGLIRIYAGIETTSERGIACLGRQLRPEDNERALRLLDARRIYHAFNLLLFDPDTTMESIVPNLELLEAHSGVAYDFCRVQIYAKTPLEERLLRQRRLRGSYLAWSYDLEDPRAELMFRIANVAFHQRNFHPEGMAHANLTLRFDAEVMRRFHPSAYGRTLHDAVLDFSRKLGKSSADYLRRIHAFAREVELDDASRIQDFTAHQAHQIHRDDFALMTRLRELRASMKEALLSSTTGARR